MEPPPDRSSAAMGTDGPPSGLGGRARALFERHRKRLATLVLVLFLAAVGLEITSAIPRETRVDIPLGASHARVSEARIDYFDGDEPVHSVTLRWPYGAPESVRHTVDLSPGEYEVTVVLVERAGERRELTGRLTAPAEGVVRLALEET
jgi:hypothetical protein